jgi:hypothetical protein
MPRTSPGSSPAARQRREKKGVDHAVSTHERKSASWCARSSSPDIRPTVRSYAGGGGCLRINSGQSTDAW